MSERNFIANEFVRYAVLNGSDTNHKTWAYRHDLEGTMKGTPTISVVVQMMKERVSPIQWVTKPIAELIYAMPTDYHLGIMDSIISYVLLGNGDENVIADYAKVVATGAIPAHVLPFMRQRMASAQIVTMLSAAQISPLSEEQIADIHDQAVNEKPGVTEITEKVPMFAVKQYCR